MRRRPSSAYLVVLVNRAALRRPRDGMAGRAGAAAEKDIRA